MIAIDLQLSAHKTSKSNPCGQGRPFPLSQWCILHIPPYFQKIINFTYFCKIYKFPLLYSFMLCCFGLIYVFCLPLFRPWCIYASCFTRTGRPCMLVRCDNQTHSTNNWQSGMFHDKNGVSSIFSVTTAWLHSASWARWRVPADNKWGRKGNRKPPCIQQ